MTFTLDQIKSVVPNGIVRENGTWRRANPDDKIVQDFAAHKYPEATKRSDYLTDRQVLAALSEPWRECRSCFGSGHEPSEMVPCDAHCKEGLIDPHPELRALVESLVKT